MPSEWEQKSGHVSLLQIKDWHDSAGKLSVCLLLKQLFWEISHLWLWRNSYFGDSGTENSGRFTWCWLEVRNSCVFADLEVEFGKAKLFFKIFFFPPFSCSSGLSLQMTVDSEIVQVTWMECIFIFSEFLFLIICFALVPRAHRERKLSVSRGNYR